MAAVLPNAVESKYDLLGGKGGQLGVNSEQSRATNTVITDT